MLVRAICAHPVNIFPVIAGIAVFPVNLTGMIPRDCRLLWLLLILCSTAASGQSSLQRFISRMDSTIQQRTLEGKPVLTPYIAPSYTPETELLISAGGLYSFSMKPGDPATLRSAVPFSIGYSTNTSLLISILNEVYGPGDAWRLSGEIWLRNMPDHFWGVGFDDARAAVRSDSTTRYQRYFWQLLQRLRFHLGKQWFVGPALDFNQTIASDPNPVMVEEEHVKAQGLRNRNRGLGFSASIDTRDFPANAYRGMLVDITLFKYFKMLGGNNNYSTLEVDYRHYFQVRKPGHTLALQLFARTVIGAGPWPEYTLLGSPFDLRGYYWGRYRDKVGLFGIAEYRHQFYRKTPNRSGSYLSSHGLCLWVGGGTMGAAWEAIGNFLPNAGFGYRFQVQPRMNIRLDYGFGLASSSFYLSFAEAF